MSEKTTASPKSRHKARFFALQALYQWVYTQDEINEIESQYLVANSQEKADWSYFSELVHGIPGHLAELDEQLIANSHLKLEEITPIELVLLRMAIFEIQNLKLHPNIVMNEYINLAHQFGNEEGYRYINGVLDKLVKTK